VRTHKELLRANITDPEETSVGTKNALGHEVIVETVGIDVGCMKLCIGGRHMSYSFYETKSTTKRENSQNVSVLLLPPPPLQQ